MRLIAVGLTLGILVGCASGKIQDEETLKVDTTGAAASLLKHSGETHSTATYKVADKPFQVEWIGCKVKDATQSVVLFHREEAGWSGVDGAFCSGWIAQLFLQQGYHVIGINRPGYGGSQGANDVAGKATLAAVSAVVAMAPESGYAPVKGAWGYGLGASAAARFAKESKSLSWLILGGGFYDLELTLEKSSQSEIKKTLADAKQVFGSTALEERSIAYDFEGLPKVVFIYHGKDDLAAPMEQAHSFRDSLATIEIDATINTLDHMGHDIPVAEHRSALGQIVKSVKAKAP